MKHNLSILILILSVVIGFTARPVTAQFNKGGNYFGPHLGLSGVGSTLTLGLDYEHGITNPGEVGPGIIGIGGLFDYYSFSEDYFADAGSWTYIDFGVSGMYHFVLDNEKWDPFIGLVLGYEVANWKWKNEYYGGYSPSAGGFTLGGSAGIRYFFDNNWAIQARAGFGFYILAVGIDYKF